MNIKIDSHLGPYNDEWVPAPRYLLRRNRIIELLSKFKTGSVLEFGCGAGTLIKELYELGFECTAVEESESALAIAKKFNQQTKNIVLDHIAKLPNNKFDYLLAFEVLEHIEDDFSALKLWRKHLNDNGKLMLSVPAHMSKWSATDVWAGHFRRYEKEQLIELLKRAGFEEIYIESYGYPLANLITPLRVKQHQIDLEKRKNSTKDFSTFNNHQSGISRSTEGKLFFLLKNPIGKLVMQFFYSLQILFKKFDLGDGYLVIAKSSLT